MPVDNALGITVAAESNIGCVRSANEDNFCFCFSPDRHYALTVVADGVGGHTGGEIASYLCCHRFLIDWKAFSARRDLSDAAMAQFLCDTIKAANNDIYQLNKSRAQYHTRMCTTVVTAIFTPQMIIAAHVGDSRLYCRRHERIMQLTVDHTLRNDLKERNATGADGRMPSASIISRALGPGAKIRPEIHTYFRDPADRCLLCSDGLTAHLGDDEINAIIGECQTPREALNRLIRKTLRNGGSDNVTAVCIFGVPPTPAE